jgi:hypothetical protein
MRYERADASIPARGGLCSMEKVRTVCYGPKTSAGRLLAAAVIGDGMSVPWHVSEILGCTVDRPEWS